MRRVIIGAVLVGAAVGLFLFLGPHPVDDPAEQAAPTLDAGPVASSTRSVAPRRSLVPSRLPHEGEKSGGPIPEPPPPPAASREESALVGLEVEDLSAADRERLKVPKAYGSGVRITRVEPDSPAAEIGLRPDDVILRAQRTDIGSVRQLETAVGGRDHTLLNVARAGQIMQAVIKKPFVER